MLDKDSLSILAKALDRLGAGSAALPRRIFEEADRRQLYLALADVLARIERIRAIRDLARGAMRRGDS